MFSNYGVDRRRRDKQQLAGGDSNLRKLEQEIEPPIGSLALVFTDIKNSTLLWDSYPAPMRSAIKIHNNIMRRQLRISGGYEVKQKVTPLWLRSHLQLLLYCGASWFNKTWCLLTGHLKFLKLINAVPLQMPIIMRSIGVVCSYGDPLGFTGL